MSTASSMNVDAGIDTGFSSALLPDFISDWSGTSADLSKLVVHQDKDCLVIFKPPGVLVQPEWIPKTPSNSTTTTTINTPSPTIKNKGPIDLLTLIQEYLDLLNRWEDPQAGLVHRIDRPCSGLLVFALNPIALKKLNLEFKNRVAHKSYLCVVNGEVTSPSECEDYLLKTSTDKTKVVKAPTNTSKERKDIVLAKLSYQPLHAINYDVRVTPTSTVSKKSHKKIQTLLEVSLITGRKHQIRAQLAHRQLPICGDVKYGAPQGFVTKDIALHSHRLQFQHPSTKQSMVFSCSPPRIWEKRFGEATMQAIAKLSQ
jgi:23S rRNA pseudouridine1911/1915/1917 synthase